MILWYDPETWPLVRVYLVLGVFLLVFLLYALIAGYRLVWKEEERHNRERVARIKKGLIGRESHPERQASSVGGA